MKCAPWAIGIAVAVTAGRAGARDDSYTELVGGTAFIGRAPDGPVYGYVRMILYGRGYISDDCPDAKAGRFVAEYDGELEVGTDGIMTAHLYPHDPPVATPQGCTATSIDVQQIDGIRIEPYLPGLDMIGFGWLEWQTLTSVNNDVLQQGKFGTLHTSMAFEPVQRPPEIAR